MLKCSLCKFFLHFMIDHGNVSLYVCIVHYIYIEREREIIFSCLSNTTNLGIGECMKNVHDIGSNVGSCHL